MAVALTALGGCIPVPKPVSLSGSAFQESRLALAPDEGIVIVGYSFEDSNVGMASCVRDAVSHASPKTWMIPLDEFRQAAGGVFAARGDLYDEAVSDALRGTRSAELNALNVRYVFVVQGSTATNERNRLGYPIVTVVGRWSDDKKTDIQLTAWDATDGERLESISTSATGVEATTFVGLYIVAGFAPTESRACRDMAGRILRFVSGMKQAERDNS
jgi:hypothetical protein